MGDARGEARALLDDAGASGERTFVLSRGRVRELERRRAYVITCAQNNTPVHRDFWASLRQYARRWDAEILVIPMRYKNPTSRRDPQEEDGEDDRYWWPPEVVDHLVENEVKIHPKLWVMGRMRIQATAVNPLAGLESLSLGASAIYGHPQVQMRTVATPQADLPKILHTTGSVSEKNYSSTKAGEKGRFHHTHGALVVHKAGDRFHLRHLNWSDFHGCFYDLGVRYDLRGWGEQERVEALVTGDEHVIWQLPEVTEATYSAEDSMARVLRPKFIVRHDLLDSYSITHHHRRDPITRFVKTHAARQSLKAELEETIEHVRRTTPSGSENVIVASNHHDHVLRWLREADPKQDPDNALLYHRLMVLMLEEARMGPGGAQIPDPFELWTRHFGRPGVPVRFLRYDESFQVMGIELGFHGHDGLDGSRGSLAGFAKIGSRTITGHRHSPGIEKGAYGVGTSTGSLEYARGPSSWLQTHGVINPNGKRQLVNIVRATWR